MAIRLIDPTYIPKNIVKELEGFHAIFSSCEYLEQILETERLSEIADELNAICEMDGVIGYHYTRAYRDDILNSGLLVSQGDDRRKEFLRTQGHRFSREQRERISTYWDSYFSGQQSAVRDGRIWFNFTLIALAGGGADRLLTYYGGESIYMPLTRDAELSDVLCEIGEPMVIECLLEAKWLRTFSQSPWGRIWLSSYHLLINPEALQWDVDAYVKQNIPAHNILRIKATTRCLGTRSSWRISNEEESCNNMQ